MTAGWQVVTIDEIKAAPSSSIAIGPFGSPMKSDRYVEEGNGAIPVIRGNNLSESNGGGAIYVTGTSNLVADNTGPCGNTLGIKNNFVLGNVYFADDHFNACLAVTD